MSIRVRALAVAAVVVGSLAACSALAVAGAQESADRLRVEEVDAREDPWSLSGTSTSDPKVEVDGRPVDISVDRGLAGDVVVVVDNDLSIPNGTVQLAKYAASEIVPGEHGVQRVAVISTAQEGAVQELAFSDSPDAVRGAVDGIEQSGDAATWDALTRATALLDASEAPSRRVVAFLSAPDKLSTVSPSDVEREMRLAGVRLDAFAIPNGVDTASLGLLVAELGGSLNLLSSDEEWSAAADRFLSDLDGQFVLEMPAQEGPTSLLTVSAGDAVQVVEARPGTMRVGAAELTPGETSEGLISGLLSNSWARWAVLVLVLAAVGGATWALLSLVVPDRDSLRSRLMVYEEPDPEESSEESGQSVATVALLQRAVKITSEVAERRGLLESVEVSLERASLPLRAAEALFFVGVAALLLSAVALVVTGNILVALIVLVLTVVLPKVLLGARVRSRQKRFVAQLPDMLSLLAGTLKAGYSITQGFEAVSKEVEDPMGRELRRVVNEHRLGRTLEDALDATAERMGSDDFGWTVMAIKIQREVGGNLAELLLTVANTMTERERLRREVATLTAEGRISAIILGFLPPGLALVMFVMNPDYIKALLTPGLGYAMIGLSLVAMVVGFLWMKKIITIKA